MKKLIPLLFILTGCSTTIVYSPKEITIISDNGSTINATSENTGSDLSGSNTNQESTPDLDLSLPLH